VGTRNTTDSKANVLPWSIPSEGKQKTSKYKKSYDFNSRYLGKWRSGGLLFEDSLGKKLVRPRVKQQTRCGDFTCDPSYKEA
jgi:hypothetical protein